MDFNITAGEEALVINIAAKLRAGHSPTADDLAEELGDEAPPRVQGLLQKGWLIVDSEGSLALSRLAQAAISSRRDVGGAEA
ncbi:hypothetical protein ACFVZM_06465 [Streptomyces sioyaensis]|uniref:hypothetical protein n=1 Tax=Streptomyces sioyaensis TaxID=67364 RepID=UPI0036C47A04